MGKGKFGTAMSVTPRKGAARRRRRQEARWASKSGPVVTYTKGDQKQTPPPPR